MTPGGEPRPTRSRPVGLEGCELSLHATVVARSARRYTPKTEYFIHSVYRTHVSCVKHASNNSGRGNQPAGPGCRRQKGKESSYGIRLGYRGQACRAVCQVILSRLASGTPAARALVHSFGRRAWRFSFWPAPPTRDVHSARPSHCSDAALGADLGVQGAVPHRQRLEHVGLLRGGHRGAAAARSGHVDARQRRQRMEPDDAQFQIA